MKVLVTGGCGFIGSAVVRRLLALGHAVVNLDLLTRAACPEALADLAADADYRFVRGDIGDARLVGTLLDEARPDAVMHLAAETHVDRSIEEPLRFVRTNLLGTAALLDATLAHWRTRGEPAEFRFHHVSTDEVYGSLGPDGRFDEASAYRPSSPYAASKAGADHLVRAWGRTYGLPVLVSNCSNNYGPWQSPDKLVPRMIALSLLGRELPLFGSGRNVRDWLHVEDHADALVRVLTAGQVGRSYAIGALAERSNLQMVERICVLLDRLAGPLDAARTGLIRFVADRPGHDLRYALDPSLIMAELGWRPRVALDDGLERTVRWYLANEAWWRPRLEGC